LLFAAARPPRNQAWRPYYAALAHDGMRAFQQFGLSVVFLADQALLAVDAIVRTLVRVSLTRRRLLEWQTASRAEETAGRTRSSAWRRMWPAVMLGAACVAIVAWRADVNPVLRDWLWWSSALGWTALAIAWLLVPETAFALSAPLTRRDLMLSDEERADALRYALRHWNYFDRFATADTNWLAPDNFQETPAPVIATRTSPTNIGLQLLATASACDLGFLTRGEMVDRLERVFDSLDRMPRVRGHFYNWYELGDLSVLDPPYVSTVDSGNLAGHLMAFAQGCYAFADGPIDDGRVWAPLEVEGSEHVEHGGVWVGERLVAYETAILGLRRRGVADAPDTTAKTVWMRQRLRNSQNEI